MERSHRSQIFDKILKDVANGNAPRPRPRPPQSQPTPPPRPQVVNRDQVDTLRRRAEISFSRGEYEIALTEWQEAIEAAKASHVAPPEMVRLELSLGATLVKLERRDEAAAAYSRAEGILHSLNGPAAPELQLEVDLHRARLELAGGHFASAEKLYINSINRYEESEAGDRARLGRLYSELGQVYAEAEYLDTAIEIVLQALNIFENAKEPLYADQMRVFQQLASLAFKKNEMKAAESHLLEAYRIGQQSETVGNDELSKIEVTIGTIYAQLGDYNTASQWISNAIQRQEQETVQSWPLSLLHANLAMVNSQLNGGAQVPAPDCYWRSIDSQLTQMAKPETN